MQTWNAERPQSRWPAGITRHHGHRVTASEQLLSLLVQQSLDPSEITLRREMDEGDVPPHGRHLSPSQRRASGSRAAERAMKERMFDFRCRSRAEREESLSHDFP
jgi:hypothetical protein